MIINRTLNLITNPNETIKIPNNELWKVILMGPNETTELKINGIKQSFGSSGMSLTKDILLSAGITISSNQNLVISGIAFTI